MIFEGFIDELEKTAKEEERRGIPLGWQLAHHVGAPIAVGLGVGALQHPADRLFDKMFRRKMEHGPYRFRADSAGLAGAGAFIGSLISRGHLRRALEKQWKEEAAKEKAR